MSPRLRVFLRDTIHLRSQKPTVRMLLGFRGAERERSERDAGDRLVYEANAKLVESADSHQAFVDVDSSAHSCLVIYHCTIALDSKVQVLSATMSEAS